MSGVWDASPKVGDFKIVKSGVAYDLWRYTRQMYSNAPTGYYEYWTYEQSFLTVWGARRYIRRRLKPMKQSVIVYQGNGRDL